MKNGFTHPTRAAALRHVAGESEEANAEDDGTRTHFRRAYARRRLPGLVSHRPIIFRRYTCASPHLDAGRAEMANLTEKQKQLLLGKNIGSLATLTADGSPQVTPVWVDWDGEYVLVNTLRSRAKPRQIERDPRVEIAVVSSENPYQHVRIAGRAELVEEGAEEHIDKLAKKYVGEDSYPWRAPGDRRVIVRIRPERVADYNLD